MSWQQYDKIKHKTILSLLYSGGLRVGELIGLRVQDVVLGHGSSKTTEIYIHVDKNSLANIISPLDTIIESQDAVNQNIKRIKNG